ncbi:Ribonuclease H-like domain-containing protein [Cynara cardunculus var. scolymus]|uniref:Ribonuclease H-like domain-containing protein n=1 Tax=Cynara cardunculus var. scolymus TaxID=59895 RepID=A0A124SAN8_CYNCS|nr:Ribonuclease H-like domain-containing protein [Cynara cardunculus var. scolymus]
MDAPAMGFLYGVINEAKEKITKNLDSNKPSYKGIWDIVDAKWERQLHRDLHATAYYLHPRFRWSPNVSKHPEINYTKDDATYMVE